MPTKEMIEIHRLRGIIESLETAIRVNQAVINHSRKMIVVLKGEIEVIRHDASRMDQDNKRP